MQANPVNYRNLLVSVRRSITVPSLPAPTFRQGELRCQATGLFVYPANDLHKAQLLTQLITSHGGIGSGKIIIALLPL